MDISWRVAANLFDFGIVKVVLNLIPTGNVPCNGSCQRRYASTDCVRQARPKAVLRPNFVQPVGKVVLDLIPTGNGLRPNFVQPVGKVVSLDNSFCLPYTPSRTMVRAKG